MYRNKTKSLVRASLVVTLNNAQMSGTTGVFTRIPPPFNMR